MELTEVEEAGRGEGGLTRRELREAAGGSRALRRGRAPGEPTTSRAGRDLPAAIGVGVVLAGVVALSVFTDRRFFIALLCLALVVAVWEMRQALAARGLAVPLVPVALGAVSMTISAYARGAEALLLATTLTCVAVLVWRVADGLTRSFVDVGGGIFVVLYPCFLAGFAALMAAEPDGHWRIFVFILITVASDIGGYAVGVLFGRHPMAPALSPKKSWEGLAGSVLASAAAGAATIPLLFDGGTWWQGALLGVLVAPIATIGDLVESSIKRSLGIKDMSHVLPGHGGLMDRLDSLVLVVPIVWAALRVIAPV